MKKFFIKLKPKIKKLLYVLPIILVCFSLTFSVPVSAATYYELHIQQPQVNPYSGYCELLFQRPEGGQIICYVIYWQLVNVYITSNADNDENLVEAIPRVSIMKSTNELYPEYLEFQISDTNATGVNDSEWGLVYSVTTSDNNGYTTNYINNSTYKEYQRAVWTVMGRGFEIVGAHFYGNAVNGFGTKTWPQQNWTVIYGTDIAMYQAINNLANIINSNNQAIIDSANQNAADIQANQDKNAADIQANQDKNTDKITEGGTDYGTVDKSQSDDYMSKEEALNNSTAMSRENTVSMFSNFGGFFSVSKLSKGLTGVTRIMSEFIQISWLSDMSNFALILGSFSFVIGAGMLAGRLYSNSRRSSSRSSKKKGG